LNMAEILKDAYNWHISMGNQMVTSEIRK